MESVEGDRVAQYGGQARDRVGKRGRFRHKAGDRVPLRFVRRSGETVNTTITLAEDPRVEVVPMEKIGGILTEDQKQFRAAWLNSKQRR